MSEELAKAVSAEVRRLVEELGWSGRELARRTGLKVTAVSYKLAGERPFDLDDLAAIARVTGVRVADVIARAEKT